LERGAASEDDQELRLVTREALGELDKAMVTVTAQLRLPQSAPMCSKSVHRSRERNSFG
jgi:hypothetical protein